METSKEEQLWRAATVGDLATVIDLTGETRDNTWRKDKKKGITDVNWVDPEYSRTPFYRSCYLNRVEVAEYLLGHPDVAINQKQGTGASPFCAACQEGHLPVVRLLLSDPRVLINEPDSGNCSPLWLAAQNGHLEIVQRILASGRFVDTTMVSTVGPVLWQGKTAAQQARQQLVLSEEDEDEPDTEYRRLFCPLIADLIDNYESNSTCVTMMLRCYPGIRGLSLSLFLFSLCHVLTDTHSRLSFRIYLVSQEDFIAQMFALMLFFTDHFVMLRETADARSGRFFVMVSRLPLELQMVLCNRIFGSGKDIVQTKFSEPSFRWLARSSTWK